MGTRWLFIGLLVFAPVLCAKNVEGVLLGIHHDPMEAGLQARFELVLVLPDGTRLELDPHVAAAAGHLHSLLGKPVLVRGLTRPSAGTAWHVPELLEAPAHKSITLTPTDRPWLVLACHYQDEVPGFTHAAMLDLFVHPVEGLARFFADVSAGKDTLAGITVTDWKPLPHPQSTYWAMYDYPRRMALLEHCIAEHDADVDFRAFAGIALLFANSIGGYAYGGQAPLLLDGEEAVRPVVWLPSWGDSPTSASVVAHEIGHAYGLRHTNNPDNDGDTYDDGWDIMSSTYHFCEYTPTVGYSAKGFAAHNRQLLGWMPPDRSAEVAFAPLPQRFLVGPRSHDSALELLSIRTDPLFPDNRVVISVRSPADYEDRAFPEPAVYIHTWEPERFHPLWVVDVGDPMPNEAITDTSTFVPGERWVSDDGNVQIDVEREVDGAFWVKVTHLAGDYLFGSGFEN